MKKTKALRDEGNWTDIKVKKTTVKRMQHLKVNMEVPTYDDVINAGLNLVEEEMK
jgi:hypothetical protein